LNLVGVMLWPLGWGVAGLITQGMISFMTDRSFLVTNPVLGDAEYSFQNLIGVAFLGVWVIFSTIAAPVIMQNAITTGSSAGSQMLGGMFGAGRTAATASALTLATVGTGVTGIGGAMTSGAVAATAGLESLATASLNEGNGGGSLIGSLAKMQPSRSQQGQDGSSSRFPANDLTGDRTVSDLIRKSRSPYQ
jgi:hypothetical protein